MRCHCVLSHCGQHAVQQQIELMTVTLSAEMGMWWAPSWLTDPHGNGSEARKYHLLKMLLLPAP